MIYSITYQEKKKEKKKIFYRTKDEVIDLIKQLYRGIAFVNGKKILSTIEELEYFNIIFQNYEQKNNKGECINIFSDGKGDIDIENVENPIIKDVTNNFLNTIKVSSKKEGGIHIFKNKICVMSEEYLLKEKSKIRDVFELIIKINKKLNKKNISYNDIEQEFLNGNYKEIKRKDINYNSIRGILKSKLQIFKRDLKTDVLILNTQGITINI